MNALMPSATAPLFALAEPFAPLFDPFGFGRAAADYWRDSVERSILYWDVMRQRGNEYLEHIEKTRPTVLGFDTDIVMEGIHMGKKYEEVLTDKEFCAWVLSSMEQNPTCSPSTKHLAKYIAEMEPLVGLEVLPEFPSETSSLASGLEMEVG